MTSSEQNGRVQYPPSGPFNSDVLQWNADDEAIIPKARFADFIAGEQNRPDFMCSFKKGRFYDCKGGDGRRTQHYQCVYGPCDKRGEALSTVPIPKPGAKGPGSRPLANKTAMGTSKARGCMCRFAQIHNQKVSPDECTIRWIHQDHRDKNGSICHGLWDRTAAFASATLSPYLSKSCREFIENMLRAGVDPAKILQEHQKRVRDGIEEKPYDKCIWSRDMGLSLKDILNVKQSLHLQRQDFSTNDAQLVHNWVTEASMNERCIVLLYQQQHGLLGAVDYVPFTLVFATKWMLQQMATLGHEGAVSLDATFGTNLYDFHLYTFLIFDKFQNGIPCAWAIMERHNTEDVTQVLQVIRTKLGEIREKMNLSTSWSPTCFIVDDAPEEQKALQVTFSWIPILLCLWHVRKCWLKNLISKVQDPVARASMNRDLGDLMYTWDEDHESLSKKFMHTWRDQESFMKYYASRWHARLEWWVKKCQKFKHSNQDTNGGIERYHFTLKSHLKADKKTKRARKLSWLIGMLTTVVEQFYWGTANLKFQGVLHNKAIRTYVWARILKCKEIPDTFVVKDELPDGRKHAIVQSITTMTKKHELVDYDRTTACCTCGDSMQGNTCKHQLKCLLMDGHEEMYLLNLLGTFFGTQYGGIENLYKNAPGVKTVSVDDFRVGSEVGFDEGVSDTSNIPLDSDSIVEDGEAAGPCGLRVDREVQEEDLQRVLDGLRDDVKGSAEMKRMCVEKVKALRSNLKDFAVCKSIGNGDSSVLVEDFTVVPGRDMSLKRKCDFIEKMHRCSSKGPKGTSKTSPAAVCTVQPFVKPRVVRESIQGMLDREALEVLDLNALPVSQVDKSSTKGRKRKQKV